MPSGKANLLGNRAHWAFVYLKKAGLVESRKRGIYCITPRGLDVLAQQPTRIDCKYLEKFPEFIVFRDLRHDEDASVAATADPPTQGTPEETLDAAHQRLSLDLQSELLDQVKSASPAFFERLVVVLLVGMGYGGTLQDAGASVGKSGDGGIDGIIKEDRLGLDVIYIQAKRWEGTVGRPEIQKFAGALQGQRARKGVFITTSSFSSDARDYVKTIDSRIVLMDGPELAKHMLDHNIGVSPVRSYEVKRIDSDFFSEE